MLNDEQKIYQLIISRIDGPELDSPAYRERAFQLVGKGIGGFIIFGGERGSVKQFITEVQGRAEVPLFIASDTERGVGQQFAGATRFPFQMAVAAAVNKDEPEGVRMLEGMLQAVAGEAADIGINMPLVPVLDVNTEPDNPIICTRAFSDDKERVARLGTTYITALEGCGLVTCAKHFPGHGATSVDSHISLPVITSSVDKMNIIDIHPFREAIKAGVSSIMIGHLSIPSIDRLPASLSEKVISGLLRKELRYNGLVLTDALNMHALKGFGSVPVQCLNAGADILLHPADADETAGELRQAAAAGRLRTRTIDSAVERILGLKSKIQNIRHISCDYLRHAEMAQEFFDRSVTLVKDLPGIFPLRLPGDTALVFAGDATHFEGSPLGDAIPSASSDGRDRIILFALFTNVSAWRGSSGIDEAEIRRVKGIMKTAGRSIVISFGSPYVLRHFQDADILIAAYDTSVQAQVSVIRCIRGEKDFQGRLPVRL